MRSRRLAACDAASGDIGVRGDLKVVAARVNVGVFEHMFDTWWLVRRRVRFDEGAGAVVGEAPRAGSRRRAGPEERWSHDGGIRASA
jgi:hypothetical protein